MVVKKQSSSRLYYLHSPFRSLGFDVCTASLAVYILWGSRVVQATEKLKPAESDTIFGLLALSVGVWILNLFLHWEIQGLIETMENPLPSPRLPKLQWSLIMMVIVMGSIMIRAMIYR
jgi:MFS superfamily sulfate permease-like transporter